MTRAKRAVFLDRDGVLNLMVYNESHGIMDSPFAPESVRAVPGAGRILLQLKRLGFECVGFSNQPGIAKGSLTWERLDAIHDRLHAQLEAEGSAWDALYVCPHHPLAVPGGKPEYVRRCDCRKPAPGLLLRASHDRGIDLSSSYVIGDGIVDIQAGFAAGCHTIMLAHPSYDMESMLAREGVRPDWVVKDLGQAARVVEEAEHAAVHR